MEQRFPKAYRHDEAKAVGGLNLKDKMELIKKPKVKKSKNTVLQCMFNSESRIEEKIAYKKNEVDSLNEVSTLSKFSFLYEKKSPKLSVICKERDNMSFVERGEKEYLEGLSYFQHAKYQKALRCFEEAAAQQYPAAYLWLGCLYENDGLIGPKNFAESMKWYNKAKEEISWFEAQVESGQVDAQFNLGWCYNFGIGVIKDLKEAVRYYQLVAAQGYAPAQNSLAWCCQYGEGIDKDIPKALHYYQLAAYQKNASAQHHLGWFYQYGEGKDIRKAITYYQLAAHQGDARAQYDLGKCYQYGEGIAKDTHKAIYYYQLAAQQGHASAQNSLGKCYQYGYGVEKNMFTAIHYYELAAKQGDVPAQVNLGLCHQNEEGTEENFKEAVSHSHLAAAKKNVNTQYNLDDIGLEKDIRKIAYYYAVKRGKALNLKSSTSPADLYASKRSINYSPTFFSLPASHTKDFKKSDHLHPQSAIAQASDNLANSSLK